MLHNVNLSVHNLEYTLDTNGFWPDTNCLAPLVKVKSSKNFIELNSIICALQYYSRLIPKLTHFPI